MSERGWNAARWRPTPSWTTRQRVVVGPALGVHARPGSTKGLGGAPLDDLEARRYHVVMAATPVQPHPQAPVASRDDVQPPRLPDEAPARPAHRERVRAAIAWAVDEYAETLEKLSK